MITYLFYFVQLVSINEAANHMLTDGQIVRFRCMIQDMFDPEIFLDQYCVKNLDSGKKETRGIITLKVKRNFVYICIFYYRRNSN